MLLSEQISETIKVVKEIAKTSNLNKFNLEFQNNSIIGNSIRYFDTMNINIDTDTSYKDKVSIILDNLENNLLDKNNSAIIYELVSFCSEIAKGFKNAYSIINTDIKNEVDDIVETVEKNVIESFKRNNLGDLLNDNLDITTDHLDFFNWDGIKSPSVIIDIISKIKGFTKLTSDDLSKVNFNIVKSDIVGKFSNNFEDIKDLDTYITDNNKQFLTSDYIDLITNKTKYRSFFINCKKEIDDIKNIKDNIKKLCTLCVDIKNFISTLNNYKDNIDSVIFNKLKKNANIVSNSVLAIQFCCAFYKDNFFKDTLIINKRLINQPVFDKVKKINITEKAIASYIRAFYLNKNLPMNGVLYSEIDLQNIKVKLYEANTSILAKKKLYMRKFINAEYIKEMEKRFSSHYQIFNGKLIELDENQAKNIYIKNIYTL